MNHRRNFSPLNLQTLESRENPAGAFTSTLSGTTLTLTGSDQGDEISIRDTGAGVTILGENGTLIDNGASKSFATVNSIKIIGKAGDDIVGFDSNNPIDLSGNLTVDLGDSSDQNAGNLFNLNAGTTINLGSLTINGGDGLDSVNFFGTTATVSGNVNINLGAGDGNVSIQNDTTITGELSAVAGVGRSSLSLLGVALKKNLTFKPGSGDSTLSINGSTIDGNVSVNAGAGNDIVDLGDSTIKGSQGITVKGGFGSTSLSIDSNLVSLTKGGINLSSSDAGVNINVGKSLSAPQGDITLTGRSAYVQANADLTARGVTLTGPSGTGFSTSNGTTAVNIAKNLNLTSKFNADSEVNIGNGTFIVSGNLSISAGGNATAVFQSTGNASINGNVTITGTNGAANLSQSNAKFDIGGNLITNGGLASIIELTPTSASSINGAVSVTAKQANGFFTVSGANDFTFGKSVNIKGDDVAGLFLTSSGIIEVKGTTAVNSSLTSGSALGILSAGTVKLDSTFKIDGRSITYVFTPTSASFIAGDANVNGGAISSFVTANSKAVYQKNLTIQTSDGNSIVNLTGPIINGDLSVTNGDSIDNVFLNATTVQGKTTINTKGGRDIVQIDGGSVFTKATSIDTGSGDDLVTIAQTVGLAVNAATFSGKTTIKTGVGNDELKLGKDVTLNAGDAFTKATFAAGSVIDGGADFNTFDPQLGQFTGLTFGTNILKFTDPNTGN